MTWKTKDIRDFILWRLREGKDIEACADLLKKSKIKKVRSLAFKLKKDVKGVIKDLQELELKERERR